MFQSVLYLGTPIQIKFISLQNLKTDRYCFLGEPCHTPLYVGRLSAWGSVDCDCIFSLHFLGGLLFGDSNRYKWINKPLALETEHLSPQGPCWGNMGEGAPLVGTLRDFVFDIHIWVPSFWTLRMLRIMGAIWIFGNGTGLH